MVSSSTSSDASVASSTKETTIGDGPTAGNVAATGAFAPRAKQALDACQTLEKALTNISLYQEVFSKVAEAIDHHVATEIELQNKNAQIACLESTIQTNFDGFRKRVNQWEIEKEELEGELEKKDGASDAKLKVVEQKLTASHAQDVERYKKALESEKNKSAALEVKLGDAKSKIEEVEGELAKCRQEVEDWNEYISDLKEVDFGKFEARIKPIFHRCCTLARNHFFRNLPDGSFMNGWEKETNNLEVHLTFPPSNSDVAKRVRMAACLHIIARSLCTHIFKPCYIPYSSSFSDGLKQILAKQFRIDPEKERITRALILSTYAAANDDDDDEVFTPTTAMNETARVSASQIRLLLNPLGATDKFANELQKIFLDAGELWKDMAQYSDKMIEAVTADDGVSDMSWEIMNEFSIPNNTTINSTTTTTTTTTSPGTTTTMAAADTNNNNNNNNNKDPSESSVLNLFPCIFVPEDGKVLFPGVILLNTQGLTSAADQESFDCMIARRHRNSKINATNTTTAGFPGGGGGGGPTRGRDRRVSSYGEGRAGFFLNSSPAAAAAVGGTGDEHTQQQQQRGGGGTR